MNFDFSITNNPTPAASIALRAVYLLHSDPTYDIKKGYVQNRDIVALRTVGGLGKVTIEGFDEISVQPGTLLLVEHAKVRRYFCSDENWHFWWFEFSTNEIMNLPLNKLLQIPMVENELNDCETCLELLRKTNAGLLRLASATFNLLLNKWMLVTESNKQDNPYREAVENAINYMKLNMNKHITVESLARMTGLCERRFRQVFYNTTGMRPKKYQENLRISIAEELLLNTPCTIYEISLKLGYSSQFHFCKAFRNIHSIPPSQFRLNGSK